MSKYKIADFNDGLTRVYLWDGSEWIPWQNGAVCHSTNEARRAILAVNKASVVLKNISEVVIDV